MCILIFSTNPSNLKYEIKLKMDLDFSKINVISTDSRKIKPGYIFVAVEGKTIDGHLFINQAIKNGATVIVHKKSIQKLDKLIYYQTEDPRIELSNLAAKIYPNQPKYILGVTGTSGKSSTVHFIREILRFTKRKAVSIGTLGVIGDLELNSNLTTPPTEDLHQILKQINERDIEYAALECSSHGIHQHRLDNVKFSACAFTNLSQDHLDYHADMEEYFATKSKLFSLMKNGVAVLNCDIKEYEDLASICFNKHEIITFGKSEKADIKIISIDDLGEKQQVKWNVYGKEYNSQIAIMGDFQVYNIACAISLLVAVKICPDEIFEAVESISQVPGRMELIACRDNIGIYVDYSHKPEALKQALINLRRITKNRVLLVFGCGGNRDQSKRKIMGEIASNLADIVFVTDDNPRNENPGSIRNQILSGCKENASDIEGREMAISIAIKELKEGDNLLIAGKGHENYQIIGDEVIDFCDKEKALLYWK